MNRLYTLVLALLLSMTLHGQRLSPADAAAVLRADHSLIDRTDVVGGDGPTAIVIPGSPTAGPFGEFPPFTPTRPLSSGSGGFRTWSHPVTGCVLSSPHAAAQRNCYAQFQAVQKGPAPAPESAPRSQRAGRGKRQ